MQSGRLFREPDSPAVQLGLQEVLWVVKGHLDTSAHLSFYLNEHCLICCIRLRLGCRML